MMVTLIPLRFFAVLDRFRRTPLNAGETLLAVVKPDRPAFFQLDISAGADRLADPAGVAFLIDPEALVHRGDMGKSEPVEPGKQDILPEGAFFDRSLFAL